MIRPQILTLILSGSLNSINKRKRPLNLVLKNGQRFFAENGQLYTAMLGLYSLPYCYAFADGAEVLVRSKRIIDSIGERLGETGSFVMEIFKPGAFTSERSAFLVCAKVRLIHAFSRYFISHYAKDWDNAYGKPVNQETCSGPTLLLVKLYCGDY